MITIIEKQLPKESQVEYITRILKKDIISLKLKPGDFLSQNTVRKYFNVSRTPVREAFIRLGKEHLVEVYPQQKTQVTLIDTEWVKDFLFMRSGIEIKIMELLDEHFPIAYLHKLEDNIKQQELFMDKDPSDFILLDNEFHQLIYEAFGKLRVWESICPLQAAYDRLRTLLFQKHFSFEITIEHHKLLLDFIKNKDTKEAILFVNKHIGHTFDLFEDTLKEYSFYMK